MGFRHAVLLDDDGHATLKVSGRGAGKVFQHETGKHVVQRVPPTERASKRQTSVVTVAVLPLPPERTFRPLNERDVEIKTQTGKQKAGGQNCNKVASCVVVRYLPTGDRVVINGRDQGQNKKEALRILTARVNQRENDSRASRYETSRHRQMKGSGTVGGRGEKERTYSYIRGTVTDHRTDRSISLKSFMKGDFADLVRQP